jgi:plasmid stabilization system protein ParE
LKVRFYNVAAREFDAAVEYYEIKQRGLGNRFHTAVEAALGRIKQFPRAYPPFSKRTRRCLVGKFPYGIIYQLHAEEILIIAIAHFHQKPEYWASRIK